MVSSKQSPIVHVSEMRAQRVYPRYRSAASFEYTDLLVMLLFCFGLYGLLMYYFIPNFATTNYHRAAAELGYHWQATWESMRHTWFQVSLFLSYLLGDWYQYLVILVTA